MGFAQIIPLHSGDNPNQSVTLPAIPRALRELFFGFWGSRGDEVIPRMERSKDGETRILQAGHAVHRWMYDIRSARVRNPLCYESSLQMVCMEVQKVRKTKLMKAVEEKFQRPLETLLPEMVNLHGLTDTAIELEVSTATISYWMLKLGIQYRRVALTAQESIEVKRPG